ncbi:MAG: hypothetical protein ABH859_02375 [Pseudomonadota bacterium]
MGLIIQQSEEGLFILDDETQTRIGNIELIENSDTDQIEPGDSGEFCLLDSDNQCVLTANGDLFTGGEIEVPNGQGELIVFRRITQADIIQLGTDIWSCDSNENNILEESELDAYANLEVLEQCHAIMSLFEYSPSLFTAEARAILEGNDESFGIYAEALSRAASHNAVPIDDPVGLALEVFASSAPEVSNHEQRTTGGLDAFQALAANFRVEGQENPLAEFRLESQGADQPTRLIIDFSRSQRQIFDREFGGEGEQAIRRRADIRTAVDAMPSGIEVVIIRGNGSERILREADEECQSSCNLMDGRLEPLMNSFRLNNEAEPLAQFRVELQGEDQPARLVIDFQNRQRRIFDREFGGDGDEATSRRQAIRTAVDNMPSGIEVVIIRGDGSARVLREGSVEPSSAEPEDEPIEERSSEPVEINEDADQTPVRYTYEDFVDFLQPPDEEEAGGDNTLTLDSRYLPSQGSIPPGGATLEMGGNIFGGDGSGPSLGNFSLTHPE